MIEAIAQSFLTGCAIFTAVSAVFAALRENLPKDHQEALVRWFSELDQKHKGTTFLDTAAEIFQHTFGSNHWSLTCIRRSTFAALAIYFAIYAAWAIFHFGDMLFGFESGEGTAMLFTGPVLTIVMAYLLLGSKRLILSRPIRSKVRGAIPVWLLVDGLLTAVLLTYVTGALLGLTTDLAMSRPVNLEKVFGFYTFYYSLMIVEYGIRLESEEGFSLGVVFYSTLLTAIWPTMFIVGAVIVSYSARLLALASRLEHSLGASAFRFAGILTGLGMSVTYWLATIVAWMVS